MPVTHYSASNYKQIAAFAQKHGINLLGVADIRRIKRSFYLPKSKTKGLNYGIVLGKSLSHYVLNTLKHGPNRIYLRHYLDINFTLDNVAHQLASLIRRQGYHALPIPASRIINYQRLIGEVSHRQLGYLAGLGWIGRSNLLINPRYGARVRYVSILTDLPLKTDRPLRKRGCGLCRACIRACAAGAIKERADNFDRQACYRKLKYFATRLGNLICGLCVKACIGRS